jgi:transposase-like protein
MNPCDIFVAKKEVLFIDSCNLFLILKTKESSEKILSSYTCKNYTKDFSVRVDMMCLIKD